jgi:hypothetical protein
MGKKLGDTTVHVQTPEGTVVYGPGDTVSAEHAKLISNPKVWAADEDEPKPAAKK